MNGRKLMRSGDSAGLKNQQGIYSVPLYSFPEKLAY